MTTKLEVKHAGRTYRVAPSQFGGQSVVEMTKSGIAKPVRNTSERLAVLKKANGAA